MPTAKETFQIGETVKLKSGGPLMTVSNNDLFSASQLIECTWFEKNKLSKGTFNFLTLEKDDDEIIAM